jgi:ubiquinone/menaquinone biosynthesis C-methylase UbiE
LLSFRDTKHVADQFGSSTLSPDSFYLPHPVVILGMGHCPCGRAQDTGLEQFQDSLIPTTKCNFKINNEIMEISRNNIERICPESEIYNEALSLNGKRILELGCGKADITRDIACNGQNRSVIALEVDERQHEKNLKIRDLPNVSFEAGGAENIPVDDSSQDIVFMFKSLHHVPEDELGKALQEIHRVLSPEGKAYISEPVYMGDFNAILSLFHDEKHVRQAAFDAIEKVVDNELFFLEKEIFFNVRVKFENFEGFENKVLNVTHTNHQLSDETYYKVKTDFEIYFNKFGDEFIAPMRVDLLQVRK